MYLRNIAWSLIIIGGDGKEGHLLDFCFSTLELHCLTDILKEQQAKLVFGVDEEVYEFCSRSLLHPFSPTT